MKYPIYLIKDRNGRELFTVSNYPKLFTALATLKETFNRELGEDDYITIYDTLNKEMLWEGKLFTLEDAGPNLVFRNNVYYQRHTNCLKLPTDEYEFYSLYSPYFDENFYLDKNKKLQVKNLAEFKFKLINFLKAYNKFVKEDKLININGHKITLCYELQDNKLEDIRKVINKEIDKRLENDINEILEATDIQHIIHNICSVIPTSLNFLQAQNIQEINQTDFLNLLYDNDVSAREEEYRN